MARNPDAYRAVRRALAKREKLLWRALPRVARIDGSVAVVVPGGYVPPATKRVK